MKAYTDLVAKFNELKVQADNKILSLKDTIKSKELLIQERIAVYTNSSDEEKAVALSTISTLKTEIQILQSQIDAESMRDLRKDADIKKLVQDVEKEYYSELTRLQNEMATDVLELNKVIPLINALYEKYLTYVDHIATLNNEIHWTAHKYMDDDDSLIGYSKDKFTNPNYMNPNGYVRFPELGKPEGIYNFGEMVVSAINCFDLGYIQK